MSDPPFHPMWSQSIPQLPQYHQQPTYTRLGPSPSSGPSALPGANDELASDHVSFYNTFPQMRSIAILDDHMLSMSMNPTYLSLKREVERLRMDNARLQHDNESKKSISETLQKTVDILSASAASRQPGTYAVNASTPEQVVQATMHAKPVSVPIELRQNYPNVKIWADSDWCAHRDSFINDNQKVPENIRRIVDINNNPVSKSRKKEMTDFFYDLLDPFVRMKSTTDTWERMSSQTRNCIYTHLKAAFLEFRLCAPEDNVKVKTFCTKKYPDYCKGKHAAILKGMGIAPKPQKRKYVEVIDIDDSDISSNPSSAMDIKPPVEKRPKVEQKAPICTTKAVSATTPVALLQPIPHHETTPTINKTAGSIQDSSTTTLGNSDDDFTLDLEYVDDIAAGAALPDSVSSLGSTRTEAHKSMSPVLDDAGITNLEVLTPLSSPSSSPLVLSPSSGPLDSPGTLLAPAMEPLALPPPSTKVTPGIKKLTFKLKNPLAGFVVPKSTIEKEAVPPIPPLPPSSPKQLLPLDGKKPSRAKNIRADEVMMPEPNGKSAKSMFAFEFHTANPLGTCAAFEEAWGALKPDEKKLYSRLSANAYKLAKKIKAS